MRLRSGQNVTIVAKSRSKGWFKGFDADDSSRSGTFPSAFVRLQDKIHQKVGAEVKTASDGSRWVSQDADGEVLRLQQAQPGSKRTSLQSRQSIMQRQRPVMADKSILVRAKRCLRRWREMQRQSQAVGDRTRYRVLTSAMGQLRDCCRVLESYNTESLSEISGGISPAGSGSPPSGADTSRRPSAAEAARARDSILRTIEASSQRIVGAITPRTVDDQPATEQDTEAVRLFGLYEDSEDRLRRPVSVAASARLEAQRSIMGKDAVSSAALGWDPASAALQMQDAAAASLWQLPGAGPGGVTGGLPPGGSPSSSCASPFSARSFARGHLPPRECLPGLPARTAGGQLGAMVAGASNSSEATASGEVPARQRPQSELSQRLARIGIRLARGASAAASADATRLFGCGQDSEREVASASGRRIQILFEMNWVGIRMAVLKGELDNEGNSASQAKTLDPVELYCSLWDVGTGAHVSEDVAISVDGQGLAWLPGWEEPPPTESKGFGGASSGSQAAGLAGRRPLQVLFADVPAALVSSGRCFVVIQAVRVGALKTDGSPAALRRAQALAAVREGVKAGIQAKSVAEAAAIGETELARQAQEAAKGPGLYRRPLGCAVQQVSPVLGQTTDGTPFSPEPILVFRPKIPGDERFFGLHRQVASAAILSMIYKDSRAKQALHSSVGTTDQEAASMATIAETMPVAQIVQHVPAVFTSELQKHFSSAAAGKAIGVIGTQKAMFVRLRSAASAASRNPLERVPRVMGLGIMLRAFALQSAHALVSRPQFSSLLATHVRAGCAAFPSVWGDVAPAQQIDGAVDGAERAARLLSSARQASTIDDSSAKSDDSDLTEGESKESTDPSSRRDSIHSLGLEAGKRLLDSLGKASVGGSQPSEHQQVASGLGRLALWAAAGVSGVSKPLLGLLPALSGLQACLADGTGTDDMVKIASIASAAGGQLFKSSQRLGQAAKMSGVMPHWLRAAGRAVETSSGAESVSTGTPGGTKTRLFLTLVRGTFSQDGQRNPRNVQVRVRLVSRSGLGITALSRGTNGPSEAGGLSAAIGPTGQLTETRLGVMTGGDPISATDLELEVGMLGAKSSSVAASDEYRSTVYYHCNSPLIGEQVCVTLDDTQLHLLDGAHLEFSFWHAFSADAKCHCYSFGLLRLSDARGVVVPDGTHEVLCYEPKCTRSNDPEESAKPMDGTTTEMGYPRADLYSGSIGPCTVAEIPMYASTQTASPPARQGGDPVKLRDRSSGAFDSTGRRPSQRRDSNFRQYPLSEWRYSRRKRDMFVVRTHLQSTIKTTRGCLQVLRSWRTASPDRLLEAIDAARRMPSQSMVQSFRLVVSPLLDLISALQSPDGELPAGVTGESHPDAVDDEISSRTSRAVRGAAFVALVDSIHGPASDAMQAAHAQRSVVEYIRDFLCAPTAGLPLLRYLQKTLQHGVRSSGAGYAEQDEDEDQKDVEGRRRLASQCLQVLPEILRIAVACCMQRQVATRVSATQTVGTSEPASGAGSSEAPPSTSTGANAAEEAGAVRAILRTCITLVSTPGHASYSTFRVLVYRQLLPTLVEARPLLSDDELRSIAIAAVRAGPVRFDSPAWLGSDTDHAGGLDQGTSKQVAWLSDAGSAASRLDLVRSLCSSWLLTDPAPKAGTDQLQPLQLLLLQSIVKVLLLHLNGRAAERLLSVDAASRLVQWAQSAVVATMFPPPARVRAESGARVPRAKVRETLRQSVLHGPTDLQRCRSAAAVQLAWEVTMLIPELASAVSGLLAGVAPAGDQQRSSIKSAETGAADGQKARGGVTSVARVSDSLARPTAMSSGVIRPSALQSVQPSAAGQLSGAAPRSRYGSIDGLEAEGIANAFASSATEGLTAEMQEWMWPGIAPTADELSSHEPAAPRPPPSRKQSVMDSRQFGIASPARRRKSILDTVERRTSMAAGHLPPAGSLSWIKECEDALVGVVPNAFLEASSAASLLGVEDPDRLLDIARGSPAASPDVGRGVKLQAASGSGASSPVTPSPRTSSANGANTPPAQPLPPSQHAHSQAAQRLRGLDAQGLPALGLLEAASAEPSVSLCRRGVAAVVGALCLISSDDWPRYCAALAPSPGRRLRLELRILRLALTLLALPPFPASWIRLQILTHDTCARVLYWVSRSLAALDRARSVPNQVLKALGVSMLSETARGGGASGAPGGRAGPRTPASSLGSPPVRHVRIASNGTPYSSPRASSRSVARQSSALPPIGTAAVSLWRGVFNLGLCLLTAPIYTTEAQSDAKVAILRDSGGDRRPLVCRILRLLFGPSVPDKVTDFGLAAKQAVRLSVQSLATAPTIAKEDSAGSIPTRMEEMHLPAAALPPSNAKRFQSPHPSVLLMLAGDTIPAMLDLGHSVVPEISRFARFLYLTTVQCELQLTGQLELVSRLTIDAIDDIVVRGGPALVLSKDAVSKVASETQASRRSRKSSAADPIDASPSPPLTRKRGASIMMSPVFAMLAPASMRQQAQQAWKDWGNVGAGAAASGTGALFSSGVGLGKTDAIAAAATFAAAAANGVAADARAARKSVWASTSGRRTSMALVNRIISSPGRASLPRTPQTHSGGGQRGGLLARIESGDSTATGDGHLEKMVIDDDEMAWDASSDDGFEGLLDHPVVSEFLAELRTLYAMLYSLAAFPGTTYFENERTEAALTLVSFLRRTHRDDIFTKYVHFLEEVHSQANNEVEEALTHTLHAALPMHPIVEAFQLSIEGLLEDESARGKPSSYSSSRSSPGVAEGRESFLTVPASGSPVAVIEEAKGGDEEEEGDKSVVKSQPTGDGTAGKLSDAIGGETDAVNDSDSSGEDDAETAKDRAVAAWQELGLPAPTEEHVRRFMELADAVSGLPPPWYWFEIPQLLMWTDQRMPAALINVAAREGSKSRRQLLRLDTNHFVVLFPEQAASERLEDVLQVSLSKLEKAKRWEHARGIARTLCERHERVQPSGSRIVAMLHKQADLTTQIYARRRAQAKYYIVVFSGTQYPPQVQGRVFILRGSVEERIGEFERRIQKRWPGCWKEPFQDALGRIGASDESRTDHLTVQPVAAVASAGADASIRSRKSGGSRRDLAYGLLSTEPARLDVRRRIEQVLAALDESTSERASEAELLEASQQLASGGVVALRAEQQSGFKMEVKARVPQYALCHRLATGVLSRLGIEPDEETTTYGGTAAWGSAAAAGGTGVDATNGESLATLDGESTAYDQQLFPTRTLLPDSEKVLPQLVREGAMSSGTRVFTVYRPFKLRPKIKGQLLESLSADIRSAQELLVLWARRTHLASVHSFPGTRRRSPVLLVEEELLTPLDIAQEQVASSTASLRDTARDAANKGQEAVESLSMRLQGVIDAGVGGGASRFPAMLRQTYRSMFPEISRAYIRRAAEVLIQMGLTRESTIQSALRTALGVDRKRTASAATGGGASGRRRRSGGSGGLGLGGGVSAKRTETEPSDAMRYKLELVNALATLGKALEDEAVAGLRDALREQMSLAGQALKLHSKVRPDRMAPLHELLVKRFSDRVHELRALGVMS